MVICWYWHHLMRYQQQQFFYFGLATVFADNIFSLIYKHSKPGEHRSKNNKDYLSGFGFWWSNQISATKVKGFRRLGFPAHGLLVNYVLSSSSNRWFYRIFNNSRFNRTSCLLSVGKNLRSIILYFQKWLFLFLANGYLYLIITTKFGKLRFQSRSCHLRRNAPSFESPKKTSLKCLWENVLRFFLL